MARHNPAFGKRPSAPVVTKAVMAKINDAISRVQEEVGMMVRTETNAFANYTYASIDQYYARAVPIARSHGLTWIVNILNAQKADFDPEILLADVSVDLRYKDGTELREFASFPMVHHIMGAQTAGSLISYADKVFMRMAFKIATGEGDADSSDNTRMRSRSALLHQHRGRQENQRQHQSGRAQSVPAAGRPAEPARHIVPDHIAAQFADSAPARHLGREDWAPPGDEPRDGTDDAEFEKNFMALLPECEDNRSIRRLWKANQSRLDRMRNDEPTRYARIIEACGHRSRSVPARLDEPSGKVRLPQDRPAPIVVEQASVASAPPPPVTDDPYASAASPSAAAMTKAMAPKAKPPPWPRQAPPPARPSPTKGLPRQPAASATRGASRTGAR